MSAHSSFSWKHPGLGCSHNSGHLQTVKPLVNPHGKRTRKLFWQRYHNAIMRGLPTAIVPRWVMAPGKPLPPGPNSAVPTPAFPGSPTKGKPQDRKEL